MSCKEDALKIVALREKSGRHVALFEGKSLEWIDGFIAGFAYFLKHGFNRHMDDLQHIARDLQALREAGIKFDDPLPGEWWDVSTIEPKEGA